MRRRQVWGAALAAVVSLGLVLGACGSSGSQKASTTSSPSVTTSAGGTGSTLPGDSGGSGDSGTSLPPTTGPASSLPEPPTPPEVPTGTFVNTHSLSLSGANGMPSQGVSTCRTTPGATCAIRFTQGATTVMVGPTTVDEGGNVTWNWTPTSLAMTAGQWTIEVVATRRGVSTTATDPLGLTVVP